jgi:hypothetical protein
VATTSTAPDLLVDWCSHEAARYAVTHWHYSHQMPTGKAVTIGVWEAGEFTGAVVFAWGANRNLPRSFQLTMTECAELVRVALKREHHHPVSAVVTRAVKLLQTTNPGLRLLVSYADPAQGHVGTIYQAMNWMYSGLSSLNQHVQLADGRIIHRRRYTGQSFGNAKRPLPAGARWVTPPAKHRYLLPLDRAMRRQLAPRALPFPQPAVQGSTVSRPSSTGQGQVQPLGTAPSEVVADSP